MNRFWICTFAILGLGVGTFLLPAVSQTKDREKPKDAAKRIQELDKKLAEKEAELQAIKVLLERERKELAAAKATKVEKAKEAPVAIVASAPIDSAAVMGMLKQLVDVKALQEKVKLKTALEHLTDRSGGRLVFVIDMAAFAEIDGDAPDPYEEEVVLPPISTTITMGTALNLILNQISPKGKATFIICQGRIEIVPANNTTAKRLMGERVFVSFDKQPLQRVLAELSDLSGLAINIDPSVGEKAFTPIRASLRNTSVEDALVIVTEMADLKFVVLHHSIYVTTASKVKMLEAEERQREKRREEFNKAPQNQRKRLEAAS